MFSYIRHNETRNFLIYLPFFLFFPLALCPAISSILQVTTIFSSFPSPLPIFSNGTMVSSLPPFPPSHLVVRCVYGTCLYGLHHFFFPFSLPPVLKVSFSRYPLRLKSAWLSDFSSLTIILKKGTFNLVF